MVVGVVAIPSLGDGTVHFTSVWGGGRASTLCKDRHVTANASRSGARCAVGASRAPAVAVVVVVGFSRPVGNVGQWAVLISACAPSAAAAAARRFE